VHCRRSRPPARPSLAQHASPSVRAPLSLHDALPILKTATRGHKLLKDKRDELMKQFLEIVRRNRELRQKVEAGLERANAAFTVAAALMSPEMLEQALLYPKQSVELDMTSKNIMSVNVPVYSFHTRNEDPTEIYP